jgi:restriction system protein
MPIPDYQTLMLPVLRLAAGGETRVPDVAERIADEFGLSQEEHKQMLPSGRQRLLHNRVHWAKFYMSKAGLIASQRRGWFSASEAGRALLARKPDRIDVSELMKIPSFAEFYAGQTKTDEVVATTEASAIRAPENVTPEEQIEAAHLALQAALRDDLLQRILQNSPSFLRRAHRRSLGRDGLRGHTSECCRTTGPFW